MLEVIHKSLVPAGGYYFYVDADSGARFQHPYYSELFNMATKHRRVNNFAMDDGWPELFGDIVCKSTTTAPCVEFVPDTILQKMSHFARAMVTWARSGFATVSEEDYNARKAICETCQFYSGNGYGTFTIACKKCGCSGLKLAIQSSQCPDNPPKWKAIQ